MTFDKPDDPLARDTALARLLAEALESKSKLAGQPNGSACPDAEVLAAYAEHGLAKEETARWEGHFADCNRCQKIIAVLAASGEELTEAEIKRFGSLVAMSVAREPISAAAVRISRRPTLWRWLGPAVGVAAAVVLWFALYPALRHQAQDSQRIASTSGKPAGALGPTGASSAEPSETQMAQANLPPPPTVPPAGALRRDAPAAQAKSPAAARGADRKEEAFQSRAQSTPPVSQVDRAAPTSEVAEKDKQAPAIQGAERQSQTVDVLGAAPPIAPAAAPAPAREAERPLNGRVALSARNDVSQLAKSATPQAVFGSPDRRALWRLGPGGHIEHSSDQGQTWQPQSSGVAADLVAGAAPSEKIAWIAGRGGIILRTEDGEHWQQVMPPPLAQKAAPGAAPDWIGIEARDALHATLVSRDLHRFGTEDGGRTWVQQQ
jgi:hypothetical protein